MASTFLSLQPPAFSLQPPASSLQPPASSLQPVFRLPSIFVYPAGVNRSIPLLVLGSLLLCSCTTEVVPVPPTIEAMYGDQASTNLTPYPSNRYTTSDAASTTGIRVHLSPETTADGLVLAFPDTVKQLNVMNGFSTTGGIAVNFSGPIDIHGIVRDEGAEPPVLDTPRDAADYTKPNAPFLLINVDPQSPEMGKAYGLVPRWWAEPSFDGQTPGEYTLIAHPATPLLPETRYLFVVTQHLKGALGEAIVRSRETEALFGNTGDPYAKEVQEGLRVLAENVGVATSDVVLATSFTTATVHDEVVALAQRARQAPAPALVGNWEVETPLGADGRIRFKAAFETPEYRKPLPDGKWEIVDGTPTSQSTVGLEVFLAFSDATMSGPRPVVIYQHGLGGDKDGSWGTAERLKDLNAAVISIDSPEHGSRAQDPDQNPLVASLSFFGIDEASQTFDIGRARDNFRQMASDQLELVRFITSLGNLDLLPFGAPDGVADLDVSRILYIGHSFGSVQGPTICALAPEIKQAVWNVGGDGLMMLLRDSGTFGLLVDVLKPPETTDGALARFFAITQAIVDPGDPLNYAPFCTLSPLAGIANWSGTDVLLQEVVADNIVPNSSSEALARAAGLELLDPIVNVSGLLPAQGPLTSNLPTQTTGAMSQFDRIEGTKIATHGELIFSPEGRAQYVKFFQTGLMAPHATIESPY